jgi:hypothetical protein
LMFVEQTCIGNSISGLRYTTAMHPPVLERMSVMSGTFGRNSVEARLVTQSRLFSLIHSDIDVNSITVVMVPDLFFGLKSIRDTMRRTISSMLLERHIQGLPTVVSDVPTRNDLVQYLGPQCADVIEGYLPVGDLDD